MNDNNKPSKILNRQQEEIVFSELQIDDSERDLIIESFGMLITMISYYGIVINGDLQFTRDILNSLAQLRTRLEASLLNPKEMN